MALQLPAYRNPVEGFTTMGQTLNTAGLSMPALKYSFAINTLNSYQTMTQIIEKFELFTYAINAYVGFEIGSCFLGKKA